MVPMNALDRLLAQTRLLPGGGAAADLPRALDRNRRGEGLGDGEPLTPGELRRGVGALLSSLAARVNDELPRVLELARSAWDQVDSVTLVDRESWLQAQRLRAAARALTVADDAAARAEGTAAALTLDAALGVATLVERRLATLVRLRGGAPTLDGARPFLELGAALAESARAWA